MSNRAELEDERAKEVARLVAEKTNCLFARFKELSLQIKKKRNTKEERMLFNPKRKISPDPPTPKSKERRCSLLESSPILRPVAITSQVNGIQGLRRGSMAG